MCLINEGNVSVSAHCLFLGETRRSSLKFVYLSLEYMIKLNIGNLVQKIGGMIGRSGCLG